MRTVIKFSLLGLALAFLIIPYIGTVPVHAMEKQSVRTTMDSLTMPPVNPIVKVFPDIDRIPDRLDEYNDQPAFVLVTIGVIIGILVGILILSEWLYASVAKMTWPFLRKNRNGDIGPILNSLGDDFFPPQEPKCAGMPDSAGPPQLYLDNFGKDGEISCESKSGSSWIVHYTDDADDFLQQRGF